MLEPIPGHSRWLDPVEPKSRHYEECDAYEDEDAECLGCPEGIRYVMAVLKERRELASDKASDMEMEQARE